ncbi:MotE family protein [Actibacterium lipolyticum]|uniref:Magnesium transporter MgtE intracellular domain-containing protein n=1 Tax=Actibacterium lipolyticum TaxID=1524263 RepID=A0A238KXL7_9RHOB|nr:hypothetical protein [Actibacterium lipolyticum]SMX47380.1 hypothetical protein COL8621_03423 [Actibacterium lipolyticum]
MTKLVRSNRRAGRGALLIVASMLAISGFIRLGSGTGLAVARQVEAFTSQAPQPNECGPSPDIAMLLAALQEREAKVEITETAQLQTQQTLDLAREEIGVQLAALKAAEGDLKATITLADSAAESDLARLTSVYESMKPKDAVSLFGAMAPEFAAGFLGRMRADSAAAILTGLEPETAYLISVILAGRNANAPTE